MLKFFDLLDLCYSIFLNRAQMSIIPQDPFLFDDTISQNLDPKDEFTDEDLIDVLEKCHLNEVVTNLGRYSIALTCLVFQEHFNVFNFQLLLLVRSAYDFISFLNFIYKVVCPDKLVNEEINCLQDKSNWCV